MLNSQHSECTIADKLHEECQEAIAHFTEQVPDHKAKSKEVFPKKSLRQHDIAPIHFELERLEDECIVPIEQASTAPPPLRRKAGNSIVSSLMAVYSGNARVWAAPKSMPYCFSCKKMLRRIWV